MRERFDLKFEDYSDKVKAQLRQSTVRGMEKVLNVIEGRVKSNAPVDRGQLRNTISHRVEIRGWEVVGHVGSPLDYAIYVEKGTGEFASNGMGRKGGWVYKRPGDGKWVFTLGNRPQPFLKPAFEDSKKDIVDILGREYGSTFPGE